MCVKGGSLRNLSESNQKKPMFYNKNKSNIQFFGKVILLIFLLVIGKLTTTVSDDSAIAKNPILAKNSPVLTPKGLFVND